MNSPTWPDRNESSSAISAASITVSGQETLSLFPAGRSWPTRWNYHPSLFWPCPHFSFPHYQISIQPVWHCLTHHLFHAPLYFANDAWRCNVANLTALPMLKGYSPLIKAEVRPFIASSSPLIVLGVSQPECCSDN